MLWYPPFGRLENDVCVNSLLLPSDIRWHFIGMLQSNKLRRLVAIPNLHVIETLDDEEKACKLDAVLSAAARTVAAYIQVNTSGEESKGGVPPERVPQLAEFIAHACPNIHLAGLMTIGSTLASSQETNPDFEALVRCRKRVADALGLPEASLELSMGMSQDYQTAVSSQEPCGMPLIPVDTPGLHKCPHWERDLWLSHPASVMAGERSCTIIKVLLWCSIMVLS